MINTVVKRDGTKEPFNPDKLNKWAEWASETCGVTWSDIVFDACRTLYEECSTSDIQWSLINTCLSRRDTGHADMAARLFMGIIYKEAFDSFSVPTLKEFYDDMVDQGYWEEMDYTDQEFDYLDTVIDHTKDFGYTYSTLRQFYDKYCVKPNGHCMESPQMAMMGIAMANMMGEENRMKDVVEFYHMLSNLEINLPTPSLNGERTPMRGSPSCAVISGDDNNESIGVASHMAYTMTASRSGIGTELSTRGPKDPVKGGLVAHGGKFSYYSYVDRAVKSSSQVSRGGSTTMTFNCLDPEVEDLLRLKSQRTPEDFRLEFMDYSFSVNNLFLKKAAKNEEWMLVSMYWAPRLHELYYSGDEEAFKAEYERVLNDDSIEKKYIVKARDILKLAIKMRLEQGRVYRFYVDNVNQNTPFKDKIRLSNLCQEVLLPTQGFYDMRDLYKEEDVIGEIALCFLGSVVVANIKSQAHYEKVAYYLCKFIDNTIEKMKYPFESMRYKATKRRSIGVGMTDVAHWMAKNDHKYDTEEGRNAMHRLAEMHSYALHKASVRLAEERGHCEWMDRTKYSDERPWLPIDTYKQTIDEYHSQPLEQDWESLRQDIKRHGVRFSVHEAYMPVESSSVFTSSTNGLYPIREHQVYKKSRKGMVFFQAPEWDRLKDKYQFAWDIDNQDLAKFYGIVQKFTGQTISADFYIDYTKKTPSEKELMALEFLMPKVGMKTVYYLNSNVVDDEENIDDMMQSQDTLNMQTRLNEADDDGDDLDCCTL